MISVSEFNISLGQAKSFLNNCGILKKDRINEIRATPNKDFIEVARTGSYIDAFRIGLELHDYMFLLNDDSFFQINYSEQELRYAIYQNPRFFVTKEAFAEKLLLEVFNNDEDTTVESIIESNVFEDEYEQFLNEQMQIDLPFTLRYDFSVKGYSPRVHSVSHFHWMDRENIRIPAKSVVSPLAFVCFSVKHGFNDAWKYYVSSFSTDQIEGFNTKVHCRDLQTSQWLRSEENDLYFT